MNSMEIFLKDTNELTVYNSLKTVKFLRKKGYVIETLANLTYSDCQIGNWLLFRIQPNNTLEEERLFLINVETDEVKLVKEDIDILYTAFSKQMPDELLMSIPSKYRLIKRSDIRQSNNLLYISLIKNDNNQVIIIWFDLITGNWGFINKDVLR